MLEQIDLIKTFYIYYLDDSKLLKLFIIVRKYRLCKLLNQKKMGEIKTISFFWSWYTGYTSNLVENCAFKLKTKRKDKLKFEHHTIVVMRYHCHRLSIWTNINFNIYRQIDAYSKRVPEPLSIKKIKRGVAQHIPLGKIITFLSQYMKG